jgi:glycosyltransferase 2 family protein
MTPSQNRLVILWAVLFILGAGLFVWSLRAAPLQEIASVLSQLQAWQIAAILLVNSGIIFLFALRWWLILHRQGYQLPYVAVTGYRLAGFALSYFTPGQHFGGEPLQVLLVRRNHKVPTSTAVAAVALDKAIELFSNFLVLAVGLILLLGSGLLKGLAINQILLLSVPILGLPLIYLSILKRGARPLARVLIKLTGRIAEGLIKTENQLGELIQKHPNLFVQGLSVSALVWAVLFFEFWLMLRFLGLDLDGTQLLAVVIAGRVALLAPTPGALGALEASQVLVMQAIGFDAAYGLSLSLLIRARDIFFALIGLGVAALSKA